MRFKLHISITAVMIVLMLLTTTGVLAVSLTAIQVTNNTPANDWEPAIDGDFLAWQAAGGAGLDLYQISTGITIPVSTDGHTQNPRVQGDLVIWASDTDGDYEIYLYEISTATTTQLTNNSFDEYSAEIDGDYIVWNSFETTDTEVYLYQISTTTTTPITINSASDGYPKIDGDYITWVSNLDSDDEIFIYEISTSTTTQISTNTAEDRLPAVGGNYVAWESYVDGDPDIYLYEISTGVTIPLTTNSVWDERVDVDGNNVAWYGSEDGDNEIFLYNISSAITTQVSNNSAGDLHPKLFGDFLTWMGTEGGDTEVYLYQISTGETTQISNNSFADQDAVVSGGYLAWSGEGDGDFEIYLSEIGSRLFEDDFETTDFSQWTRFNSGGGWLYPCTNAAINGSWGACIERGTNNRRKQLIDETPVDQTNFIVRLNIDINGLSMSEGERFRFAQAKMGNLRPFGVVLKYTGGQYYIKLKSLSDDLSKTNSSWYLLTDAVHTLEVAWGAAGADGSNDGYAEFYLDDGLLEAMPGLDNDSLYVDCLKIGFTSRLEGKNISGVFYIDDVATSNLGHIGLP